MSIGGSGGALNAKSFWTQHGLDSCTFIRFSKHSYSSLSEVEEFKIIGQKVPWLGGIRGRSLQKWYPFAKEGCTLHERERYTLHRKERYTLHESGTLSMRGSYTPCMRVVHLAQEGVVHLA